MLSPKDKFIEWSRFCFVSLALILGLETALVVTNSVQRYDGFCLRYHMGKFPCTFSESIVYGISVVAPFSALLLTPIPGLLWGIAVGRLISFSLKLGRGTSFFLIFNLAIAGGILGHFIGARFPVFISIVVKILGI
jgi:hypothetical protein